MSMEKFCLKWNDFEKNVSTSFQEIREDFCNVTLAGEGHQKIEAHKVVLAASSNFFHEILKQNQHPHPLLYMRGIKSSQLASVVDFMYYGEVSVYQEDLDAFLAVAEELQIKGLTGNEAESKEERVHHKINLNQSHPKNRKPSAAKNSPVFDDSQTERQPAVEAIIDVDKFDTTEQGTVVALNHPENRISTTNEDLDERIRFMMTFSNGQWSCTQCVKTATSKQLISNHIEAKHIEGVSHPCNHCGKLFRSRNSLNNHNSLYHKKI